MWHYNMEEYFKMWGEKEHAMIKTERINSFSWQLISHLEKKLCLAKYEILKKEDILESKLDIFYDFLLLALLYQATTRKINYDQNLII